MQVTVSLGSDVMANCEITKYRLINKWARCEYSDSDSSDPDWIFTAWTQSGTLGVAWVSRTPRDRKLSNTAGNCPKIWSADCTSATELAFRTLSCWRISAASPRSSTIFASDSRRISFTWVESIIEPLEKFRAKETF